MPQNSRDKVLTVHFYKSNSGNEPVRDWLKLRTPDEKKIIGEDIKAIEYTWPVGYPSVTKLDTVKKRRNRVLSGGILNEK